MPLAQDTDFVQSFIDFPPPPASQVGFDSSTAVVINSVFSAKQDLQVQFSKLDASVETATRIQRAQQAWELFCGDVKQRSGTTMECVFCHYAPVLRPG